MTNDNLNTGNAEVEWNIFSFGNSNMVWFNKCIFKKMLSVRIGFSLFCSSIQQTKEQNSLNCDFSFCFTKLSNLAPYSEGSKKCIQNFGRKMSWKILKPKVIDRTTVKWIVEELAMKVQISFNCQFFVMTVMNLVIT
jgi:hypothetical protein